MNRQVWPIWLMTSVIRCSERRISGSLPVQTLDGSVEMIPEKAETLHNEWAIYKAAKFEKVGISWLAIL
jgi:hypothetical protein